MWTVRPHWNLIYIAKKDAIVSEGVHWRSTSLVLGGWRSVIQEKIQQARVKFFSPEE